MWGVCTTYADLCPICILVAVDKYTLTWAGLDTASSGVSTNYASSNEKRPCEHASVPINVLVSANEDPCDIEDSDGSPLGHDFVIGCHDNVLRLHWAKLGDDESIVNEL